MAVRLRVVWVVATVCTLMVSGTALAKTYSVMPGGGNSNMTAVFDAPLGERITAISSQLSCTIELGKDKQSISGKCSIPLTTVMVDNEDIKTAHFQLWATNRKMKPEACMLELDFGTVKLDSKLTPRDPIPFSFNGRFKVCGRTHSQGTNERISGQIIIFPAGTYREGAPELLRIRARIRDFSREAYQVGPEWTGGLLAKVQALASAVSKVGDIDVSLFAQAK